MGKRMLLVAKEKKIEISHYHYMVSAYHSTDEMVEDLRELVRAAWKVARATGETQIVDQDGRGCFHVHPSGAVSLMYPLERFDSVEDMV